MSEAPGAALGPETTLETGTDPATVTDRREGLAAALDALEPAPADSGSAPVEAAPSPDLSGETPADSAPAPVAAPEPWEAPPTSWRKEHHELYKTLPPEAQRYVSQREEEMRRGIEPLIPKAKFADEMQQAMQPFEANIRAAGVPPVAAVHTLMQADNILRNAPMDQKIAYLQQLLPQYGIDLGGLGIDFNHEVDPRISALRNELTEVRGTVMTWQQEQRQAQEQEMQSAIGAFAADHEHFDALRMSMSELMKAGLAQNLEEAYQKALRLDENLFSAQQASSQAAAEAARRAAADKAAKAARAAAVSTRTSSPGGASATKATDRRSLLAAQISEVGERL